VHVHPVHLPDYAYERLHVKHQWLG